MTPYRSGTILRDGTVAYHSENLQPSAVSRWGASADVSGLPPHAWMRLTCAVADLAGVFCYSPFSSAAGSLISRRTLDCRGFCCLPHHFRVSR
jgi:hypothetical protein